MGFSKGIQSSVLTNLLSSCVFQAVALGWIPRFEGEESWHNLLQDACDVSQQLSADLTNNVSFVYEEYHDDDVVLGAASPGATSWVSSLSATLLVGGCLVMGWLGWRRLKQSRIGHAYTPIPDVDRNDDMGVECTNA